jgi:hypothetical protein
MQHPTKKPYLAPAASPLGSVEEITGWFSGGAGEYFGGNKAAKVKVDKGAGPADFGS